jgi:uncharacterized protein
MKPCLVDVNLFLALIARHHEHYQLARAWYSTLGPNSAGMARVVQLSLVRLLSSPAVQGRNTVSTRDAWQLVQDLLQEERTVFLPEPPDIDQALTLLLTYNVPTPKLLNDAYLAAFAISSDRRLATIDGGFTAFRGLDLFLLRPATPA